MTEILVLILGGIIERNEVVLRKSVPDLNLQNETSDRLQFVLLSLKNLPKHRTPATPDG